MRERRCRGRFSVVVSLLFTSSIATLGAEERTAKERPTPQEAAAFVERAEAELRVLEENKERAEFVYGTDQTEDHARLYEAAGRIAASRSAALAKEATAFEELELPDDVSRKLVRLRLNTDIPAPADPARARELGSVLSALTGSYSLAAEGRGAAGRSTKEELYETIATSSDPDELRAAWAEWMAHGQTNRAAFAKMVDLANEGAEELGFDDVGAMWRSHYDMTPAEFEAEYDRLWNELRPLYVALHCHVRAKLREKYGEDAVPEAGPIPAHLLGNMAAQEWTALQSVAGPGGGSAVDLTRLLNDQRYTPHKMVWTAEDFFMSLGFRRLPSEFWERSMFTRPEGKSVDCQGSAWPVDPAAGDVRLRMCIDVNADHFQIVHHELGHLYYYLAYADKPFLFQDGANPGFHEAIGDTVALSITPEYLRRIGLLDEVPNDDGDLDYLFAQALDKIPQFAMARVVDKWRWEVFSGRIGPDEYDSRWWELRQEIQGLSPPTERTEDDFDAVMFYHVTYNIPYDRYFTAQVLQFDFHKALCAEAGHTGALHRGSIYGSREAGAKLQVALGKGVSEPWPDVMQDLTGHRRFEAAAVSEYFAPVKAWLDEQNRGRQCGW